MSQASKAEIIRKFRELVNKRQINRVKVIYGIAGGPPGMHLSEEITFFGNGNARLMRYDEARSPSIQKGIVKLEPAETLSLFEQIAQGLDSLNEAEAPIFFPDSVVSSFTIELQDKKVTVCFLSYESDRLLQNKSISKVVAQAAQSIELISQRVGSR